MPILRGAPHLPKTTDTGKVNNVATSGAGIQADSLAAGMIMSSADVAFLKKQREARIARGEDPGM